MNYFLRKEKVHGMKKIMVSLTPELESELIQLKNETYKEKSETEMYCDLIRIGLKSAKKIANIEHDRKEEGNGFR